MDTRPWKQPRIIELPRSRRQFETEPLQVLPQSLYCGACGVSHSLQDVFCGMCGKLLQEDSEYATVPFGLTVPNWQGR